MTLIGLDIFGTSTLSTSTESISSSTSTTADADLVSLINNFTLQTSNNVTQLQKDMLTLRRDMDDMFIVFCAIITSFVQVGFACLEAGFVNSKNVTNIVFKNVLDTLICAIFYWLFGYSLAFTPGNAFFGYSNWAGQGLEESKNGFWVFQFIFASTASTILSGSVAERCSFVTYIAYSSVISGFIYPVVSHWAWDDEGWLKKINFMDLSGSGVVHALGGTCALVAAIFLGPRIGRFKDGKVVDMPGHSMSLVGIGGLILISGFLGFNAGSLLKISGQGPQLGRIVQNTVMGGAGAAALVLIVCRAGIVGEPKWAFSFTVNGVISGIVAVCGGIDLFTPFMALVSGVFGCLTFLLVRHVVLRLQIDDPLDCVGVHFGGGFAGVIAGPLFNPKGIVFGINNESLQQLWHNLIGSFAIFAWASMCSIVLFGSLWLSGLLRVSEEDEIRGMDISKHNEPAYPVGGWTTDYPPEIHKANTLKQAGSYTLNRSDNGTVVLVGARAIKLDVEDKGAYPPKTR